MRLQILIALLIFFTYSCKFTSNRDEPKTFYNTISGWDISYIPIIEPYRATSLDKGITWSINRPEVVSSFDVIRFGVSNNFIYGKGSSKWFLLDTKSRLFAEYDTKQELLYSLKSLMISIKPISECNSYFDSLADNKKLYWFPKDGKSYPTYPNINPDTVVKINVTGSLEQPDFFFSPSLPFKKSRVYFFLVSYNQKNNDLYYLSIDNSPPVLVRDSLLIPAFCDTSKLEITLYTPYSVAQENHIPEEKRFLKTKTIYIK
ncbi:MAG: hypothetical protein M9904_16670 [Chitinophagaceae bacterium]|nr:hypothetical protein [Chitinophagaceae bacterium]